MRLLIFVIVMWTITRQIESYVVSLTPRTPKLYIGSEVTFTCKVTPESEDKTDVRIRWKYNHRKLNKNWTTVSYKINDVTYSNLTIVAPNDDVRTEVDVSCKVFPGNIVNETQLFTDYPICSMDIDCVNSVNNDGSGTFYCRWVPVEDGTCSCRNCYYSAKFETTDFFDSKVQEQVCEPANRASIFHDHTFLERHCQHIYDSYFQESINFTLTTFNVFTKNVTNRIIKAKVAPGSDVGMVKILNTTARNSSGLTVYLGDLETSVYCKYNSYVEYKILPENISLLEENYRHKSYIEKYWTKWSNNDLIGNDTSAIWKNSYLTKVNFGKKITMENLPPHSLILLRGRYVFVGTYSDTYDCYSDLFFTKAKVVQTSMLLPLAVESTAMLYYPEGYHGSYPFCGEDSSETSNLFILWNDVCNHPCKVTMPCDISKCKYVLNLHWQIDADALSVYPQSLYNIISSYTLQVTNGYKMKFNNTRHVPHNIHCMPLPTDDILGDGFEVYIQSNNDVGSRNNTQLYDINSDCEIVLISAEAMKLQQNVLTVKINWTIKKSCARCMELEYCNINSHDITLLYWKETTEPTINVPRITNEHFWPVKSVETHVVVEANEGETFTTGVARKSLKSFEPIKMKTDLYSPYRLAFSITSFVDGVMVTSKSILINSILYTGSKAPVMNKFSLIPHSSNVAIEWGYPSVFGANGPINKFTLYYSPFQFCSKHKKKHYSNCYQQLYEESCEEFKTTLKSEVISLQESMNNKLRGKEYIGLMPILPLTKFQNQISLHKNQSWNDYFVWISASNQGGEGQCSASQHVSVKLNSSLHLVLIAVPLSILVTALCAVSVFQTKRRLNKANAPKPYICSQIDLNLYDKSVEVNLPNTEEEVVDKMILVESCEREEEENVFINDSEDQTVIKKKTHHDNGNDYFNVFQHPTAKRFSNLSYIGSEDLNYVLYVREDSGVWSGPNRSSNSTSTLDDHRRISFSSDDMAYVTEMM